MSLRRFELREYLAREPAALRLAAGEVVTCEYLRHEQQDLRTVLADLPEPTPAGPQAGQVPPPWAGRPGFRYRRGPRLLPLVLLLLFVLLLFHGGGFVFFALFKIALVLFLVAALTGIFTVARFRRRARRYWRSGWQSGPGGHRHHDEWHRQ